MLAPGEIVAQYSSSIPQGQISFSVTELEVLSQTTGCPLLSYTAIGLFTLQGHSGLGSDGNNCPILRKALINMFTWHYYVKQTF